MTSSPFLGVGFHWIGGLAAASFYVPYRGVKRWSWETYWLVGGFFSWIVAPWAVGLMMTQDLVGVLSRAPANALFWPWFFGVLWGLGGLTFGLSMRYLGVSLGYGVALGICAICGTLIPPMLKGMLSSIAATAAGKTTLAGIAICVFGIALSTLAGVAKAGELTDAAKRETVKEFDLKKGIGVALFCGVLSACMAFGLEAAAPLAKLAANAGTAELWTGLPKLVIVLLGGFTSNAIWCITLNLCKGTMREYLSTTTPEGVSVPRLTNLMFCAFAGVTWYFQFFFYTMGETQMGAFRFSSWTLHMASIIIFSALWGYALKEWRGTSRRTRLIFAAGVTALIVSTLFVGYGSYLGSHVR